MPLSEPPTVITPAAFYSQARPAFFGLIGLLGGSNIQVQLVLKIYGPAITYLENAMIILAAEHLLNQYVNNMGMEGIITGASLSFHIFNAGGSVIEGNGFSRIPGRNKVYLVGPNQVNAARGVIDAFRAEVDGKSINSIIKYIKGIAQAVDDAGGSAQESTQWPTDLAFGCILTDSNQCLELVYQDGFNSVYSRSGFPIPAPVLIMVTNLDNGQWAFSLFNFLPGD